MDANVTFNNISVISVMVSFIGWRRLKYTEKIANILRVSDTLITYIKLSRVDLAMDRSRILVIVQP